MTNRHVFIAGIVVVFVSLVVVKTWMADELPPARRPETAPTPQLGLSEPSAGNDANASTLLAKSQPDRSNLDGQPALNPPDPAELSTRAPPPLASLLGKPGTKPEEEAKIVLDLLKTYRRLFGVYPAGEDNRQFVNALLGANKDKLPLLPLDHPRLNAKGELVDAWGTPFFFHQNSRTSIEVRSAGADRSFFTADDVVAGKPPADLGQSVVADEDTPET